MVSLPQWGEWMEKVYVRLMQPRVSTCIVCNNRINGSSSASLVMEPRASRLLPLLCSKCLVSIPWIQALGCPSCGRSIRCTDCKRHPLQKDGLTANRSVVQYDEQMKQWLAEYKFRGNVRYERIMTDMMISSFSMLFESVWTRRRRIRKSRMGLNEGNRMLLPDIITYVPTSEARLRVRGFNQAEQLAQSLGRSWKVPVLSLLARVQDSEKQSMQSRGGRATNIAHAFVMKEQAVNDLVTSLRKLPAERWQTLEEVRLLLVDDVYTTGSTLRSCAREFAVWNRNFRLPVALASYTWARA
ncbi:ComF family protein [Paenibacillus apiarius]|uniref:ComF family protein n=1 Tax=Paenibacillus apiarius TaxID=46240 RepID=A0ABT4DSM7_9BACL|nr:ComF family protein [Paenibacillus apiarius]MCY9514196.1 ComF family protein [Paenibacillus apiarius]MCY9520319.1 ComF family protein [Paenibacillus apiarius]MCY9554784.1 ComF family protein [Paenibacillus apiarius]MCY9557401.1 ComF family protein [Paenibacillus apiarius]MCY9682420.1 ComF family protein [Paenibacillus apiarius]